VSVADGTISYVCRAPSHRVVDGDWVLATLHVHIHEAEWAFCPAGEPNAHEWVAIEPTRLAELKLRLAGKIR
jgi:hypothetical protein